MERVDETDIEATATMFPPRSNSRNSLGLRDRPGPESAPAPATTCVSPSKKPPLEPPDGDWGWVVVGASFFAHLIADGCGFSFGVLFSELLTVFGESKSRTAWVGSLFVSVPAICGPVASAMTNRYGCRVTTILGGIIGSVGCLMGAFANSIGELCFTFGIVAGFGLSLVFVPAVVIVAFYFKRMRGLATGMAVAGSGIGTFIFAPLTELLIDHYQWRGALMITAGILLNLVVCGALFRPLDEVIDRILLNDRKSSDASCSNTHWPTTPTTPTQPTITPNMQIDAATPSDDPPRYISRSHPEFLLCAHMTHNVAEDYVTRRRPYVIQSLILLPLRGDQSKKKKKSSLETSSLLSTPLVRRHLNSGPCRYGDGDGRERHSLSVVPCSGDRCRFGSFDVGQARREYGDVSPANRSQSFDSHRRPRRNGDIDGRIREGSLFLEASSGGRNSKPPGLSNSDRCVFLRRQDIVYRGSLLKAGFFLRNGRSASCPVVFVSTEERQGLAARLRCLAKDFLGRAKGVVDFSVCRSAVFNYFCLHTVLLYISYDIPYVYGPDRAMQYGISEDYAPILVAIIGIFSTMGQVVMGYVGDQVWVNVLYFYNSMTSIAGLLTVLVPFVFTFLPLSFLYAGYGFFISANFALTTVILVELLGMQKLTNAFGMVSLAQGIANLFGPPLAGWLSDVTGSYDAAFYGAGLTILVSGLMLFAAPWLAVLDGSSPPFRMTMNDLPVYLGEEIEIGDQMGPRSGSLTVSKRPQNPDHMNETQQKEAKEKEEEEEEEGKVEKEEEEDKSNDSELERIISMNDIYTEVDESK